MDDNLIISSSTSVQHSTSVNASLLKLGTFAQTILGAVITATVVAATIATVTLIGTGATYKPPIANPDSAICHKRSTVTLTPLVNDIDPKGGALQLTSLSTIPYGSATITGNGRQIVYTAAPYYAGPVMFNYTISDGKLSATSYINITVVNEPPVAADFFVEVSKNSANNSIDLFNMTNPQGQKITDADNDKLAIVSVSEPLHGTVTLVDSVIYYTPNPGSVQGDYLTYYVTDFNDTVSGHLNITIRIDPPIANPDSYYRHKDQIQILYVMDNDVATDGDPIYITSVGTSLGVTQVSSDGTYIIYTPQAITTPYSDSFEYTISNNYGQQATSYAIIQLYNTAPVTVNRSAIFYENTANNNINLRYSDIDILDTHTAAITQQPANGQATLVSTSQTIQVPYASSLYDVVDSQFSVLYTPNKDFLGSDSFTFTITDCSGGVAYGQVTIAVISRAPVAVDDGVYVAPINGNVTLKNLLLNDYDPDQVQIKFVSFNSISTLMGGQVLRVNDSTVIYVSPPNYFGPDQFVYTIQNVQENPSYDLTASANVSMLVVDVPPVVSDIVVSVPRDNQKTVSMNDYISGSRPLTITSVTQPSQGTVSIAANNNINIQTGNTVANVMFTYTVTDRYNLSSTGNVFLEIINIPPIPANINANCAWNQAATSGNDIVLSILTNYVPVISADVSELSIYNFTQGSHGQVQHISRTQFMYAPNPSFSGIDSFKYWIQDAYNVSTTYGIITVNVVCGTITAKDETVSTHWGTAVSIKVLRNDIDSIVGDTMSIDNLGSAKYGSASISNNVVVYTPPSKWQGTDTFTYTSTDGCAISNLATVTVKVTDTAPQASNFATTSSWSKAVDGITVNAISAANAFDPDSQDTVSLLSISTNNQNNVTTSQNSITFVPAHGFTGSQDISVTFTDGLDNVTVTYTVTITNSPPVAQPQKMSAHWTDYQTGLPVPVLTQISDSDGDTISLLSITSTANGQATINPNGTVTFTQSNVVIGTASFTITFTDGWTTESGTWYLGVTDTAPVAGNVFASMNNEQGSLLIPVLDNCYDANQDNMVVSNVTQPVVSNSQVTGVSVKIVSGGIEYTQTPSSNLQYNSTFTYNVFDGAEYSNTAIVTVFVSSSTSRNFTVQWRQFNSGNGGANLNVNETDLSLSKVLSIEGSAANLVTMSVQNGFINLVANTPDTVKSNFIITYMMNDSSTQSALVVVYDDAPTGIDIKKTISWTQIDQVNGIIFDIIGNPSVTDIDPLDQGHLYISRIFGFSISNVNVTIINNGDSVAYLPSHGFVSTLTFSYELSDGWKSNTYSISITVTDTPPKGSGTFNEFWRSVVSGVTLNLSPTITAPNPIALSIQSGSYGQANVQVVSQSQQTVSYQMAASQSMLGVQSFTVMLDDSWIPPASAQYTVNISDSAPVASSVSLGNMFWKSSTFTIDLVSSGYATDADSGDMNYLSVHDATVTNGAVSFSGPNITYSLSVSPSDLNVVQTIKYRVTDGLLLSNYATITFQFVDTAPVGSNMFFSTLWSNNLAINLNSACTDSDSSDQVQTVVKVPNSLGGSLSNQGLVYTFDPSNSITYTSIQGTHESTNTSFTYVCTDGLLSNEYTVTIEIYNDKPVGSNQVFPLPYIYGQTSYQVNLNASGTIGSDTDGDSLSITTLSGATLNPGTTIATVTVGQNFKASSQTFTYKLFDGQLHSDAISATINFENSSPNCQNTTGSLYKGNSGFVSIGTLCNTTNGGPLQIVQYSVSNPYLTVSLSSDAQTLTYTAPLDRSGLWTITYQVADYLGYTTPVQVAVTVQDRQPIAENAEWSLLATRSSNQTYIYNYWTNAMPFDYDTYDYPRLYLTLGSGTTCTQFGNLTVDGHNIVFNKQIDVYNSSCLISANISDVNIPQELSTVNNVTVSITTLPISAGSYSVTIPNMNTLFTLTTSTIMSNAFDPLNGTLEWDGFDCNQAGYCRVPPQQGSSSNTYYFTQLSNGCMPDYYLYRVRSKEMPSLTATGVLTVYYTDCQCSAPMDILFLVDLSASIGTSRFDALITSIDYLASQLPVSSTEFNIGVIRYDGGVSVPVPLDSSLSAFKTQLKAITYSSSSSSTYLRDAYKKAINIFSSSSRPSVPKLVVTLLSGIPNGPCSCTSCDSQFGGNCKGNGVYPYRQCNACSQQYSSLACGPCADPRSEALYINSQSNWKNLVFTIGDGVSSSTGQQLVHDISYDPNRYYQFSWSDLPNSGNTFNFLSVACGLSSSSKSAATLDVLEPNQPKNLKCCDIITIRLMNNYLYVTSDSSYTLKADVSTNAAISQFSERNIYFQIQCQPNMNLEGANLYYENNTVYLWSLQSKMYVEANNGGFSATASVVSEAQPFNLIAAGNVLGLAYYESSFGLQIPSSSNLLSTTSATPNSISSDDDNARFYFKTISLPSVPGYGSSILAKDLPCQIVSSCGVPASQNFWPPVNDFYSFIFVGTDMVYTIESITTNQQVSSNGGVESYCPDGCINKQTVTNSQGQTVPASDWFSIRAEGDGVSGNIPRLYNVSYVGQSTQSIHKCVGSIYFCVAPNINNCGGAFANIFQDSWYNALVCPQNANCNYYNNWNSWNSNNCNNNVDRGQSCPTNYQDAQVRELIFPS